MYRIGVDVGGTNTDAVIMRGREIIATQKATTSHDVAGGLTEALTALLDRSGLKPVDIGLVVIGTTRFTNAVVERRSLEPTAVVRLCLPATQSLPPMIDWPEDLARVVGDHIYMASGGFEFDGRPITPLDEDAIRKIGADIRSKRLRAIALCGVFSSVDDASEKRAAAILTEVCPDADISISAGVGRLGLLERESATILNSALLSLARQTISALKSALADCGLSCSVYISQNDGTLMSAQQVQRYPVLTFASGPTNSMRGAAFLSNCTDALIIDIGGTTSDVGLLQHGFPRQATQVVEIGGVRTNFRMPDLLSIGLGGGSIVLAAGDPSGAPSVGPVSVGFEIATTALVFGGSVTTATDIAVAGGRARVGDHAAVSRLDPDLVLAALAQIDGKLESAVDRCRISAAPLPILAVGGGAILAPGSLGGVKIVRPPHSDVANAIGAAIAQTSGEVDRVFSLDGSTREAAFDTAEAEARRFAVAAGADADTLVLTEKEDVPLAYLPGNATRIRVKVVGDLKAVFDA